VCRFLVSLGYCFEHVIIHNHHHHWHNKAGKKALICLEAGVHLQYGTYLMSIFLVDKCWAGDNGQTRANR
jgi:hypothetical protein